MHRLDAVRALPLGIDGVTMRLAESAQRRQILRRRVLQNAEHQGAMIIAHADFDLRQLLAHRQAGHQLRQQGQFFPHRRMQYRANVDVRHERAALFAEAHQRTALLAHVFHAEPRLVPVAPQRPAQNVEHLRRLHLADAAQLLQQQCLLVADLRLVLQVLQAAPAADAGVGAMGRDALPGGLQHRRHLPSA